jgi:hypothetical protein
MPQFQEWFVQLVGMISEILVGVAAVIGISSFWQWRREMVGKTRYELARKIVSLALKYEQQINEARNPMGYSNEADGRECSENETEGEKSILNEQYARWKRLQPIQETIRELQEVTWEAELLFQQDEIEQIHSMLKPYNTLAIAYQMYFRVSLLQEKHPYRHNEYPAEKLDEYQNVVYGVPEDDFSRSLGEVVTKLKSKLKRYIQ